MTPGENEAGGGENFRPHTLETHHENPKNYQTNHGELL
jgi:hypothetical protein